MQEPKMIQEPAPLQELKPKTVNYLNNLAEETQELFAKAVEYRTKIESSKTSVAKQVYENKLKKLVKKLDANMGIFSMLEERRKLEALANDMPVEDSEDAS